MKNAKAFLGDRKRQQRGSILSGLLIIVAFLSILVGALMSELTSSFLVSRALASRVAREATVTSAVELGINQLQQVAVPPVCVRDSRGPWFVSVNGYEAAVTQTCEGIVPDTISGPLAPGAFSVDGTHDTAGGRDGYLVSDTSGKMYSYRFGRTAPSWSIMLGGPSSGPSLATSDSLFVPVGLNGSGCAGHCVAFYSYGGGSPTFQCSMSASATVTGQPATEVPVGGQTNFTNHIFFGDSNGSFYVYSTLGGGCAQMISLTLGSVEVGAALVFPGRVTNHGDTTSDEVFTLVTDSSSTKLQHWRYSETLDRDCGGSCQASISFSLIGSPQTLPMGGNAIGYAASATAPSSSQTLSLAVVSSAGRMALATISVASGPSYSMGAGANTTLPGAVSHAPYWCHCPSQDLVGVGSSTDGNLYLLTTGLSVAAMYNGQAAINSTPMADANGDWYFGADDGNVYDVEVPTTGMQMFKAATFGPPGGAIHSSPVVGRAADGCGSGPCLYFASSTAGAYFAQLGTTRITDLRACVSDGPRSTNCALNPHLWARVEVGSPAMVGPRGVLVQGWSYYSP